MNKVPSLNYQKVINALRRDGWVVVRQKGSHIRLQKHISSETLKIIVPAHSPIKRSTACFEINRIIIKDAEALHQTAGNCARGW